jgi:predicted secreted protein
MPHVHGKNVDIKILEADTTATRLEADGNSVTLTWTNDIAALMPFGVAAAEKLEGIPDWSITMAGYYHTADARVDEIFGLLATCVSSSTAASVAFGGSTAGCPFWYGNCILADYSVEGPSDGPVTFSATLAGSGVLARAAVA